MSRGAATHARDVLAVGAVYFAVVFSAGFALGLVRVLWLVPRLGARAAELMEAPIMLLVCVIAALWLTGRFGDRIKGWRAWLAVGLAALGLMILAEFTAVLWMRGVSLEDYLAHRDPVTSRVYLALLGVFAILPALVSASRRRRRAAPARAGR